jgi:dynamin 1-like protein
MEVVSHCLSDERDKTEEILTCVIDSEEGYLFTNDYEYLMNRTDIVPAANDEKKQHLSSTTVFVMELRQRIDSYFSLVIRNVRDRVPKTIGNFLVKKVQDKIQFHLYSEINKNSKMSEVLGEHPAITQERDDLSRTSEILKHATKVLQRDPDITNVLSLDDKLEKDLREDSNQQALVKKASHTSSSSRRHHDETSQSNKSSSNDFNPPGGNGEPYDRSKRESMNPHMQRAQQQQQQQQMQQQRTQKQQPAVREGILVGSYIKGYVCM